MVDGAKLAHAEASYIRLRPNLHRKAVSRQNRNLPSRPAEARTGQRGCRTCPAGIGLGAGSRIASRAIMLERSLQVRRCSRATRCSMAVWRRTSEPGRIGFDLTRCDPCRKAFQGNRSVRVIVSRQCATPQPHRDNNGRYTPAIDRRWAQPAPPATPAIAPGAPTFTKVPS